MIFMLFFQNLFAFGDKDGSLYEAKLQHALGVAVSKDEKTLFVADTYNHKLKKIDISQNSVVSLNIPSKDTTDGTSSTLKEPAGLCLSSDNKKLYLADTNNHTIKVLYLDNKRNINKLEIMELKLLEDKPKYEKKSKYRIIPKNAVTINNAGGKLILNLNISFQGVLGLTEDAPQSWVVDLPDPTWSAVPKNGTDLQDIDIVVNIPESDTKDNFVDLVFDIVTCTSEVCLPKTFVIRLPVKYAKSAKTHLNEKLRLILSPNDIKVV